MANISYAITACNEIVELERLLDQLTSFIKDGDEIAVLVDSSTAPKEIYEVINKYYPTINKVKSYPLNKDFAQFKNQLFSMCEKDYIVFLDADELLSDEFLNYIHQVLESNPEIEYYNVPRWNTVEGITQEHIKKWGWRIDSLNRINFPDYQGRIVKNGLIGVLWKGKVHERIQGYKVSANLPDVMYILHPKTIEKQQKQNDFYNKI